MPEWTTMVRYLRVSMRPDLYKKEGANWTYADDGLGADQLDMLVLDAALGVALGIGLDVAQVANVAVLVGGSTVGLVVRVDYNAAGERAGLRPGGWVSGTAGGLIGTFGTNLQ